MRKTVLGVLVVLGITLGFESSRAIETSPLPPEAGIEVKEKIETEIAEEVAKEIYSTDSPPVFISIPSTGLSTNVVEVGVNAKGEMDVPSGKTQDVGWYKYGTIPGSAGSAVMDAHVYAAFSSLKYVEVGDLVHITMQDGQRRTFVVEEIHTYKKDDVPLEKLFNRSDASRLNLITCAGIFSKALGTYTHRLVVYAKLAE